MAEPRPGSDPVGEDRPGDTPDADLGPDGVGSRLSNRLRGWLWSLTVLALVVHLLALYLPGTPGGIEIQGPDKVVHLLLFAVPVYLLGLLTGRVRLVAAIFAVHAVVSELIQLWFIPYRDGDVFDATADLIGVALAVWLLRRRASRKG